ncbi:Dynein light chain [Plasmodiophora brassicae]
MSAAVESRPGQAPVAKEKRVPKLDRSKDKSITDDVEDIAPPGIVKSSTMSQAKLQEAVDVVRAAYLSFTKGEGVLWKDVARQIKVALDAQEKSGAAWHVVCGSSFGAFVSYEADQMAYITVGVMDALVFKHA